MQIAAKCGDSEYFVYIKPTQAINEDASVINGLRFVNGNLQFHEQTDIYLTLLEAMLSFYEYLCCFKKSVFLLLIIVSLIIQD